MNTIVPRVFEKEAVRLVQRLVNEISTSAIQVRFPFRAHVSLLGGDHTGHEVFPPGTMVSPTAQEHTNSEYVSENNK